MSEEKSKGWKKIFNLKNLLWLVGAVVLIVLAFLLAYAVTTFIVV